jgi:hypothetical protein
MQFYEFLMNLPNFLFSKRKTLNLGCIKSKKMKNKGLWITLGLVVLSVGGYFLIRQAKFKSNDPQKNDRKIQLISTIK